MDPYDEIRGGAGSFLRALGPEYEARLRASSSERAARAGELIFPPTARWTRVGCIVEGTARAFLESGDGRQLTLGYMEAGSLIGNVFPVSGDRAPFGIAAVTDCRVVEFDAAELARVIRSDGAAASLVLLSLSRRLEDLYAMLAANAFGSVRGRIAGHLLDLAHPEPGSGQMVAAVTQQQLADGVGTVREVVARALGELRNAGVVATSRGRIEILDATRLESYVGRWWFTRAR